MEEVIRVPLLIAGAGISGMGAAFKARQQGQDFVILEGANSAGGMFRSKTVDGHTLDLGPNSCASSPAYEEFISYLGLGDQLMLATAAGKKRYLYQQNRVVPVGGLKDILGASWISLRGKFRFLSEPFRKRGNATDESVFEFLRRRIGAEATEKLADPVLGGIYAGNIHYLSAQAVLGAMKTGEQQHGSLLRTLMKNPPKPRKITSISGGFQTVAQAFEEKFSKELQLGVRILNIATTDEGMRVETTGGTYLCDKLVCTLPAHALAQIISDERLQALLGELSYAELDVSHFEEVRREEHVDGFGVLVPSKAAKHIKGVLFTSSVFEGRAPEGKRNMTVFHSGGDEQALKAELDEMLGGHERRVLSRVHWACAIPQPHVGFEAWKEALLGALPEGMELAGNYLGKVGVADVFSSGYDLNLRP